MSTLWLMMGCEPMFPDQKWNLMLAMAGMRPLILQDLGLWIQVRVLWVTDYEAPDGRLWVMADPNMPQGVLMEARAILESCCGNPDHGEHIRIELRDMIQHPNVWVNCANCGDTVGLPPCPCGLG